MKALLTRTSIHNENDDPKVPGAVHNPPQGGACWPYYEDGFWTVEIDTLAQLMDLIEAVDCKIIVSPAKSITEIPQGCEFAIEIYDGWRE